MYVSKTKRRISEHKNPAWLQPPADRQVYYTNGYHLPEPWAGLSQTVALNVHRLSWLINQKRCRVRGYNFLIVLK
jgi:hypothetical protein